MPQAQDYAASAKRCRKRKTMPQAQNDAASGKTMPQAEAHLRQLIFQAEGFVEVRDRCSRREKTKSPGAPGRGV
jgi:hypothetical protein